MRVKVKVEEREKEGEKEREREREREREKERERERQTDREGGGEQTERERDRGWGRAGRDRYEKKGRKKDRYENKSSYEKIVDQTDRLTYKQNIRIQNECGADSYRFQAFFVRIRDVVSGSFQITVVDYSFILQHRVEERRSWM